MILVVGGIKGGSGKTMLATHLAVYRAAVGPTLLMDADEQASATDFTRQRHHRLGAAGYQSVQAESHGVLTRAQELAPAHPERVGTLTLLSSVRESTKGGKRLSSRGANCPAWWTR